MMAWLDLHMAMKSVLRHMQKPPGCHSQAGTPSSHASYRLGSWHAPSQGQSGLEPFQFQSFKILQVRKYGVYKTQTPGVERPTHRGPQTAEVHCHVARLQQHACRERRTAVQMCDSHDGTMSVDQGIGQGWNSACHQLSAASR
jgi:hypothetical protein